MFRNTGYNRDRGYMLTPMIMLNVSMTTVSHFLVSMHAQLFNKTHRNVPNGAAQLHHSHVISCT